MKARPNLGWAGENGRKARRDGDVSACPPVARPPAVGNGGVPLSGPAQDRRRFLTSSLAAAAAGGVVLAAGPWLTPRAMAAGSRLRIGTFNVDVTPPLGHPLMGGGIQPAQTVADPLTARGFVLVGGGRPVVVLVIDWCEIRNDAYAAWQLALARAAGTEPSRVLVSSVHVHDAPISDLAAEALLQQEGGVASVCQPRFHAETVGRVAAAVRTSLRALRPVTHVGHAMAAVEQVASNRRFFLPSGEVSFSRTSASRDPNAHRGETGIIDPLLRTVTFFEESRPLAALHVYSTHPMSHYGKGQVSADFVGIARDQFAQAVPDCLQIYASGCSGNVTAGKHNNGDPSNRAVLAGRIQQAMEQSWARLQREPVSPLGFSSTPYRLPVRSGAEFSESELRQRLRHDKLPFGRCLAALGLSWRQRQGTPLSMPVLELGPVLLALFPGETYVEFQLEAQRMRRDRFLMALGYGECGPGYVPTDQAWRERDTNLRDWSWVDPGAEGALREAMERALVRGRA